jgi:hypothetical protein
MIGRRKQKNVNRNKVRQDRNAALKPRNQLVCGVFVYGAVRRPVAVVLNGVPPRSPENWICKK